MTDEFGVKDRSEVWTIQKILLWSTSYLKEKCPDINAQNFRLEAELLLGSALNLTRIQLYLHLDKPVSTTERNDFKKLLTRRVQGEPVPYILGVKEFFGRSFKVTQATLIPRADTEILVEEALEELKKLNLSSPRILDVGTGTGCLSISLALEAQSSSVETWDISESALEIARENAETLNSKNVLFINRNALDPKSWVGQFDLVVSNPPYIPSGEQENLSPSVVKFEPHLALFGGDRGVDFYQIIAENGRRVLNSGGRLLVEIGLDQRNEILPLFEMNGWKLERSKKDLSGIERVLVFS